MFTTGRAATVTGAETTTGCGTAQLLQTTAGAGAEKTYGCGAYGITAVECYYMLLESSVIRECTYGCVSYSNSYYLYFTDDRFLDCKGFEMLDFYYSTGDFQDCVFENLQGTFLYVGDGSYVSFEGCEMDAETRAWLENQPGFGTQITGDWESASSAKAKG